MFNFLRLWRARDPQISVRSTETTKLSLSLLAICIVLLIGVCGFRFIEGWRWFDALYMTVITLSTVGFQEVHPLSDLGRAFTVVLILLGVGVVTVLFSTVTQVIIERQTRWLLRKDNMEEKIAQLNKHTIICGYGRLAKISASQLRASGLSLLILDKDQKVCEEAKSEGYLTMNLDATLDDSLVAAGILRAQRIVSLLPKDSDNLYVILTSRELNPKLYMVSWAQDEAGERRLIRAGANRVMSPYRVGGQKIADAILRPNVTDFIDIAVSSGRLEFQIEEIAVPEKSTLVGLTLEQARLPEKANVMVTAIINKGDMTINPSKNTVIQAGSTLIALGAKSGLSDLERLVGQT